MIEARDFTDDDNSPNSILFSFFVLFLIGCLLSVLLLWFRRRRAVQHHQILPVHNTRRGHHRSLTITSTPAYVGSDRVFVYDEKMNLIANSHGPPDSTVPEIRVTFPDEVGQDGQKMSGRVVVVRITDSGSVGMEPFHEQLPPYQQADSGRFQSLELDRIGGLRETAVPPTRPRWS